MIDMRFVYSDRAQKDLANLSREVRERILGKLKHYSQTPDPLAFAKRLHDDPDGTHRFQINDWRAKFIIESNSIWITRIRHRSKSY